MKILAISGSIRSGSHNTSLLREIAERAPVGVEVKLWNGLRAIPPYDADIDNELASEPVHALRKAIADADGLLFSTPEYNASIPGVLKNAVDWASRPPETTPLRGKPAAVVGATTGRFGAVWAQAELRKVLRTTGARVVDLELPVAKAHELLEDRGVLLADDRADGRSRELFKELIAEIERNRSAVLAA